MMYSENIYKLFIAVIFLTIFVITPVRSDVPVSNIYKFGPGVHELDELVLDKPHALLQGAGRGITILKLKKGVHAIAPNPIVRDITIVGSGFGIGLRMTDVWAATVENISIENFREGIRLELSDNGRKLAEKGKTKNGWPSVLDKGSHFWGSRVTRTEIKNAHVIGDGDGIVLKNHLKDSRKGNYWKPTQDDLHGEFFSATTIWGGHIGVSGRSMVIGDGVWSTKVIGTYMDIAPPGGIHMEYGAYKLTLIGVSLEPNTAARKNNSPKILANGKAAKSISFTASGITNKDIVINPK